MDPLDPRHAALLTDLYQIAMSAAYRERGHNPRATFEVHFRSLPAERGYVLAAGLEQVAQYLLDFRFQPEEVHWLRNLYALHAVSDEYWQWLAELRFSGDLWAAPEGTPIFPDEPMLRLSAPLAEAQLFETYILATVGHQSLIATKTARTVEAAQGRDVIEFGSRRCHGPVAGVLGARAAYCAGAAGSSNLEAGRRLGVPVYGTMAHAYVMSFADEEEAFRSYIEAYPHAAVLILDTYDTLAAARRVAEARLPVRGVRLDSGDLAELSRAVRKLFDDAGMTDVKILASGDLDEYRIARLVEAGAPIDAFGVGTQLATSADAPALGVVYKLVELGSDGATTPVLKRSADKATLPGVKQVYRRFGPKRIAKGDTIALADEKLEAAGAPVLACVLKDGAPATSRPGLESIREFTQHQLATLPEGVRRLRAPERYPVELSPGLAGLRDRLTQPGPVAVLAAAAPGPEPATTQPGG